MRSLLVVAVCTCACVTYVSATPYVDQSNLEYWAGDVQAANSATLVVDFGSDNHFAFGYRWDGEATSWDMLSAVCSAGNLDETHTGDVEIGFGVMVKSISYGDFAMDNDDTSEPGDTWLVYWDSIDGNHWSVPWTGISSNPVADGSWNGWTATPTDNWPGQQPIPEPTTLLVLVAGALGLAVRKR